MSPNEIELFNTMETEEISFEELFKRIAEWQQKQFLSDQTPPYTIIPLLNHLKKEVKELIEKPYDQTEWADVMILVLGGFFRAFANSGIDTPGHLIEITRRKLEINKYRKWGKSDEEGVIEHIK